MRIATVYVPQNNKGGIMDQGRLVELEHDAFNEGSIEDAMLLLVHATRTGDHALRKRLGDLAEKHIAALEKAGLEALKRNAAEQDLWACLTVPVVALPPIVVPPYIPPYIPPSYPQPLTPMHPFPGSLPEPPWDITCTSRNEDG